MDPTTGKSDDLTEATNECVPQKNLQGLSGNEPGLAGMLDDRAKQEDDNIEDETEVKEHAAGTDKEMKLGKACYCINCDSGVESKGDVSNHMYETHVAPTTACGNCHTTFKDVLYLESHKEGYNDYVLKCEMSSSYEVGGKEPKEHLKEEHEESAGPKKQKQRDTIRTENYANMNLFECDKCKYNFRRTNELEDHIQDYHCIEYTVS